jgi:hypothetical protein
MSVACLKQADRCMELRSSPFLLALTAAFALTHASPAAAACPQELAVYEEAQAEASLTFTPVGEGPDPTLGRFTIRFPENAVALDGVIMAADEPQRPWGIVMHKCPEGDVTGEELAACTIWEGVVYGLDEAGNAFYLPPLRQGDAAAATILLPDFAGAVRLSSVWGKEGLSSMPKDDFKLSGCQE